MPTCADAAARIAATPHLQHRIALSPDAPRGGLAELATAISDPHRAPHEVDEEDTAIILYTSGTTGRPKGAMLTHLGICHSAMHYECCMGLDARDRSVVAVPMSHVTGVVALIAGMVRAAGTLIVMRTFKAGEFLDLAERERMTHTLLVPAMYNLCLLEPRFERADLSALASWRLRRRADGDGDHRAPGRAAAAAATDECLRRDGDDLARDADATA